MATDAAVERARAIVSVVVECGGRRYRVIDNLREGEVRSVNSSHRRRLGNRMPTKR